MCFWLVPVYYGERPVSTRGKPNESKDYYFECYHKVDDPGIYNTARANSIEELCVGCKKYDYIKPMSKEEINEKYYKNKSREVLVVSRQGWHFKTVGD